MLLLDVGKLLLSNLMCSQPQRDAGLILHVSTVAESPSPRLKFGAPSFCKPSTRLPIPPLSPWWGVLGVYELFLSSNSWANVITEKDLSPFWTWIHLTCISDQMSLVALSCLSVRWRVSWRAVHLPSPRDAFRRRGVSRCPSTDVDYNGSWT